MQLSDIPREYQLLEDFLSNLLTNLPEAQQEHTENIANLQDPISFYDILRIFQRLQQLQLFTHVYHLENSPHRHHLTQDLPASLLTKLFTLYQAPEITNGARQLLNEFFEKYTQKIYQETTLAKNLLSFHDTGKQLRLKVHEHIYLVLESKQLRGRVFTLESQFTLNAPLAQPQMEICDLTPAELLKELNDSANAQKLQKLTTNPCLIHKITFLTPGNFILRLNKKPELKEQLLAEKHALYLEEKKPYQHTAKDFILAIIVEA